MAASIDFQEHANFMRLGRLLVDKGTEALRITLDAIHPPANLPAVLYANKKSLLRLKYRVIKDVQWDLLFPSSGNPPDSKTFDVTLLTVLLRNICWSTHPPSYWQTMPPDTDRTPQANVLRIKLFRNEVYAHATSTRVDETTFESLWQKISQALVDLNIPAKEIDDLKISTLGPQEEGYVQILKEWFLREKDCKSMLNDIRKDVLHLTQIAEGNSQVQRQQIEGSVKANSEDLTMPKLAKHNFKSKIARKVESFHPGTRDWLLKDLDLWFRAEGKSTLLLLTAGPGFGKSVFAAKVCELYRENGELGACHFCDFRNSNLKDPMIMMQSLASHMCENVVGFEELLLDQLKRHHKVCNLNDAFQIYLQNPLDELEVQPFLIVIDGLDESATDEKSDMIKLITDYFPDLPKCVKVLLTSRPELSLKKLDCIEKIEIVEDDEDNELDLQKYLKDCLPPLAISDSINQPTLSQHSVSMEYNHQCISSIAKRCEGSFHFAFHVQRELRQRKDLNTMTLKDIIAILPQGLGSVYKEYFRRLEIELKAVMKKEIDLSKLSQLLVACNKSVPLAFVARALGLDLDCRGTKKIIGKVNDAISCLLYVSDDLVTVFHKSVYDWLLAEGYEDHEYAVKASDGKKQLWLLCKPIFEEVKGNVLLGNDFKLTNEVKHALRNGYDYLIKSSLTDNFEWLVDMVIVHFCLTNFPDTVHILAEALYEVLRGETAMSLPQRQRISWHFVEICNFCKMVNSMHPILELPYLELVIDYSPEGCFTKSEIDIAKLLVAKVPRCVTRYSIGETAMKTHLVKPFSSRVTAVGVSSNKQLAAVAVLNGTIFILSLPELVTVWQYSTDHENIPCCTFAPNDSFVLYGKLEMVLSIEEEREITYFKGMKEQFNFCAFSPNGKRLVTSDGSNTIKLWDVVQQSLVSVLYSEVTLNRCSFSNTGFFVIGCTKPVDEKPSIKMKEPVDEESYCVWSAITSQRVDVRSTSINKSKHGAQGPKSEICYRCNRPERAIISGFKKFTNCRPRKFGHQYSMKYFIPYRNRRLRRNEIFFGTYHKMECIFYLSEQSLRVVELLHSTSQASWAVFLPEFTPGLRLVNVIVDITWIGGNVWLYSTNQLLIVLNTGTLEDQPHPSRQTLVLWCSFSPDGTRLATCTSDGCVNLWNVTTCQIYQRVKNNVGTSVAACCWSHDHLFVFHLIEKIPNLRKYVIDENWEIDVTKVEPVSLCSLVNEFEDLSTIIDFSEGYLSFDTFMSVKVLDVNVIKSPEIAILPKKEAITSIVVSTDASVILGARRRFFVEYIDNVILWKRKKCQPVEYDEFVPYSCDFYSLHQICCFSNDFKLAVVFFDGMASAANSFVAVDIETGNLAIKATFQGCEFMGVVSKVFCTNMTLILALNTYIKVVDIHSEKVLEYSLQRCLTDDFLSVSRLSPNGTVIAVPNVIGDIEFLRLSIPAALTNSESLNRSTNGSSEMEEENYY